MYNRVKNGQKACGRCGNSTVVKNLRPHYKDGRTGAYCIECYSVLRRQEYSGKRAETISRASQWNKDHPERFKTHVEKYRQTERYAEINRIHSRKRYAQKKGAAGFHTPEQVAARIAYYGGLCYLCGALWQEIDHVIPLALGGSNWPSNLRPACRRCNASKNARPLEEVLNATA